MKPRSTRRNGPLGSIRPSGPSGRQGVAAIFSVAIVLAASASPVPSPPRVGNQPVSDVGPAHWSSWPRLSRSASGTSILVWQQRRTADAAKGDFDTLFSRSIDGGAFWSAALPLVAAVGLRGGDDQSPQVATDGRATWLVTWWSDDPLDGATGRDADVLFTRSSDDGASWSPPSPLNRNAAEDSGGDYASALATDGRGKWIATWWSDDSLRGTVGGDYDVFAARSGDGGITWTPPSPLNTNAAADSGDDRAPQIATDGRLWLAAWESSDTLGGRIGTDKDILSARSRNAGKTWSEPTPLVAAFASDAASDSEPSLATDGAGNWLVAWHSTAVQKGMIGRSTRVLVSRSSDGGRSWSEPHPLNAASAARALQPRVAAVERGHFAVVWSERSFGEGRARAPSVIRLSVSRDAGATWDPPASLTDGPADDEAPDVTGDGTSGWIVAWQSASSAGGSSIVVHRHPGSVR